MAHKIAKTKDGKDSFAAVVRTVSDRPWHGLGQFVDKAMTSQECIVNAGLDYRVEKKPLYVQGPKKQLIEVHDKFATVREDNNNVLGTVGNNYQIIQNVDAFSFFDAIVGKNVAMFETAGSLGRGEKIFITAKLPKHIKLVKDGKEDVIEQYLFLTNSHDGSCAITVDFTPIRIVCNNTLNMALSGKSANRLTIKHTNNSIERLKEAHKIMGMVDVASKYLEGAFEKMIKVRITDQKLKEYIAAVMSNSSEVIKQDDFDKFYSSRTINLTEEIFTYAKENETQLLPTTKGTAFGAYNAITGYYQNMKAFDTQEEKFDSMIISNTGTAKKHTVRAFDLALNLS